MTYEVWLEGYVAIGQSAPHRWIGIVETDSFKNACEIAMKKYLMDYYHDENEMQKDFDTYFDRERLTYWGCRFFDNENDAKRLCG